MLFRTPSLIASPPFPLSLFVIQERQCLGSDWQLRLAQMLLHSSSLARCYNSELLCPWLPIGQSDLRRRSCLVSLGAAGVSGCCVGKVDGELPEGHQVITAAVVPSQNVGAGFSRPGLEFLNVCTPICGQSLLHMPEYALSAEPLASNSMRLEQPHDWPPPSRPQLSDKLPGLSQLISLPTHVFE